MLERQRDMVVRTGRQVREHPGPALAVVGLAMLLIAGLAGVALYVWTRRRAQRVVDAAVDEAILAAQAGNGQEH
jgi:hypothetical protein